jgi:hypothetical protein
VPGRSPVRDGRGLARLLIGGLVFLLASIAWYFVPVGLGGILKPRGLWFSLLAVIVFAAAYFIVRLLRSRRLQAGLSAPLAIGDRDPELSQPEGAITRREAIVTIVFGVTTVAVVGIAKGYGFRREGIPEVLYESPVPTKMSTPMPTFTPTPMPTTLPG